MNTMFLEKAIMEARVNGDLSPDEATDMLEFVFNAFEGSSVSSYIKELEEIKNIKPSAYDGPKEVKKFVDVNYDRILKIAAALEKEPKRIGRDVLLTVIGYLVGVAASYASTFGGLLTLNPTLINLGPVISVTATIVTLIRGILHVVRYMRDRGAVKNLSKIKHSLKKVADKSQKLDPQLKGIIQAIEDIETEFRMTTESSEDISEMRVRIYEAYFNDEISLGECNVLIERCENGGTTGEPVIEETLDTALDKIVDAYESGLINDDEYQNLLDSYYEKASI